MGAKYSFGFPETQQQIEYIEAWGWLALRITGEQNSKHNPYMEIHSTINQILSCMAQPSHYILHCLSILWWMVDPSTMRQRPKTHVNCMVHWAQNSYHDVPLCILVYNMHGIVLRMHFHAETMREHDQQFLRRISKRYAESCRIDDEGLKKSWFSVSDE